MEVVALSKYRQVGGSLGAYIRANNPSTQQVKGLLSDLLAGDELLPVMSDMATKAAFARIALLTGSGKGEAEIIGITDELRTIYTTHAIASAEELLRGMLDLSQKKTSLREAAENTISPPDTGNNGRAPGTSDPINHHERGLKFYEEQNYPAAAYAFELESRTSNTAEVQNLLRILYFLANEYPSASQAFKTAVEKRQQETGRPSSTDLYNLANSLKMEGKTEYAIAQLDIIAEFDGFP